MRLLSEHEKEQKQRSGRLRASAPFSPTTSLQLQQRHGKTYESQEKKGYFM